MTLKLYNCFHDSGSKPADRYRSAIRPSLICGCDIEWRHNEEVDADIRDNEGENISAENLQYSELTGYYWIWKNEKDADVVGIEHYRRHFIKSTASHITDYVSEKDLATEEDILPVLDRVDYIIPVPQSLANTSVYDLYVICFHEEATEIVKWMKEYFKDKPNYLDVFYDYMSHNVLCRGNMLITKKAEFDNYCTEMFGMIDFMKANMKVRPESRVWGYVTELFPMIYMRANNKTWEEMHIAVDDFNQDIQKEVVYTTFEVKQEPFDQKDPEEQIAFFKSL